MKYIITAKNIQSNNSVTNPLERTEICTELIMTRLKTIEYLNENFITKENSTIVTLIDRKCLYENLFDNIIDWSEFEKIQPKIKNEDIIDLVSKIYSLCGTVKDSDNIQYFPFYNRFKKDSEEIFNIKYSSLSNFDTSKSFLCILIRTKKNISFINQPDGYWEEFINKITKDYGVNIFVFGQNINNKLYNKNVFYIDKFQDWCSLMNNNNCKAVVSTITGGVHPIFVSGHNNSILIVIDEHGYVKKCSPDPSFFGDSINFTKTKIEVIEKLPTTEEFVKIVKKIL